MRSFLLAIFWLSIPLLHAAVRAPSYGDLTTARFAPLRGLGPSHVYPTALEDAMAGPLHAMSLASPFPRMERDFSCYEQLVDQWATQLTTASQRGVEEYNKVSEHISQTAIAHLAVLIAARRALWEDCHQLTQGKDPLFYFESVEEEATFCFSLGDVRGVMDVPAVIEADLSTERIERIIDLTYRSILLQEFRILWLGCKSLLERRESLFSFPPSSSQILS